MSIVVFHGVSSDWDACHESVVFWRDVSEDSGGLRQHNQLGHSDIT